MSRIRVLILLCLCLLTDCLQRKAVISGRIVAQGAPIQRAEISLSAYKDEECVRLSKRSSLSEEDENRLHECSKSEFAKVMSDSQGQYTFQDVSPGWYKVDAVFDLSTNSGSSSGKGMNRENEGEFTVYVLSALDSEGNGLQRAMAFGKHFYIPAGANVVKNLDY